MKLSSPPAPLSPARARNCALINQLGTPGLGSLMARRYVAGTGQLCIFVAGFIFFVIWFIDVMRQFYGLMWSNGEIFARHWLAYTALSLCAFSWLWSLVTSISLIHEAKRIEREGKLVSH